MFLVNLSVNFQVHSALSLNFVQPKIILFQMNYRNLVYYSKPPFKQNVQVITENAFDSMHTAWSTKTVQLYVNK